MGYNLNMIYNERENGMQSPKSNAKKRITVKDILILQAVIVIFTFSGVIAKIAAGKPFLSFEFFLFYGIEMMILAAYAVVWQQVIKRFDLSVAYANRAMGILWSMLWAFLIFSEPFSLQNVIGVILVFAGIIVVNSDDK